MRPLADLQRKQRENLVSEDAEHQRVRQRKQRELALKPDQALQVLAPYLEQVKGISLSQKEAPKDRYYLSITIDRTERQPAIATAPTSDGADFMQQDSRRIKRIPYSWLDGPSDGQIKQAIEYMQLDAAPPAARAQIAGLISTLARMYKEREAISLAGCLSIDDSGNLRLHQDSLLFQFDESAFKSGKRQEDIFALRRNDVKQAEELEAEMDGIVFVRLDDAEANIGTLVNGAGLAMNTVDALRLHGGRATNFLDTGGKATSETVKKSFELILRDPRVKVIFVNIFGGLTDGGMIANGILLAFKEVDMKNIPVVVRIRGTNEEVGQKTIADSGLGLEAFDTFADAAKRVVAIANGR